MSIAANAGIHPREMAEAHWNYVEGVLIAHGVGVETRMACQYHYVEAFVHGWKHCEEAISAVPGVYTPTAKAVDPVICRAERHK